VKGGGNIKKFNSVNKAHKLGDFVRKQSARGSLKGEIVYISERGAAGQGTREMFGTFRGINPA